MASISHCSGAMQNRGVDLVPGQFLPDSCLHCKIFNYSQPLLCLAGEANEKAAQGQLNLGKLVRHVKCHVVHKDVTLLVICSTSASQVAFCSTLGLHWRHGNRGIRTPINPSIREPIKKACNFWSYFGNQHKPDDLPKP
ncbi:hypothetical protein llap_13631 [Limosa lapponica baueri]|uniref:Uncharacterized protein n=1 Tax=Limosa lapponica baueri TaxID=1758121 RepID=A0A2I0TQP6_LIMLA|nr:hypothetical protein llap_13631 [Limosa lapponica baueri]